MKIGCLEVIQIFIIIFKLVGIINCSWLIVFLPTIIAIFAGFIYGMFKSINDNLF